MNTLYLNPATWDLELTPGGDIKVATGKYAIAQDVASAVRTFLGECWYDINRGVPFLEAVAFGATTEILGRLPSLQFMKTKFIAAALTVPGVASAKCFLTGPGRARQLGGQIQVTDDDGDVSVVETTNLAGVASWYVTGVSVPPA